MRRTRMASAFWVGFTVSFMEINLAVLPLLRNRVMIFGMTPPNSNGRTEATEFARPSEPLDYFDDRLAKMSANLEALRSLVDQRRPLLSDRAALILAAALVFVTVFSALAGGS